MTATVSRKSFWGGSAEVACSWSPGAHPTAVIRRQRVIEKGHCRGAGTR